MTVLFEDQHLQVIHAPHCSAYAVVTFNTKDTRPNGRDFWGQVLAERYGIECFGFVSKAANWYPAASMHAAAAAIQSFRQRPLLGYGHSMGGYAAVKYSALLGLRGAVASAPQITIDPADNPDDTRYARYFDPVLHRGMMIRSADVEGRIVLAHDSAFALDRLQVEAIRAQCPGAELFPLPHTMHRTVEVLRPRAVLLPLFEAILGGLPIHPILRAAHAVRKAQPRTRVYLARHLLQRARPQVAVRLLLGIAEDIPANLARERSHYLARAHFRAGDLAAALALYDELVARVPGNPLYAGERAKVQARLAAQRVPMAG